MARIRMVNVTRSAFFELSVVVSYCEVFASQPFFPTLSV